MRHARSRPEGQESRPEHSYGLAGGSPVFFVGVNPAAGAITPLRPIVPDLNTLGVQLSVFVPDRSTFALMAFCGGALADWQRQPATA
jgi:hypothetical protein